MMNFPKELKYTKSHEWAKLSGGKIIVGISDYAQKEISDVVFIELPKIGQAAQQAKPVAVVESVKAAFDIYAPVSGKVTRVNADCYGQGWFLEIEPSGEAEWNSLMSAEQYENHIKQAAH